MDREYQVKLGEVGENGFYMQWKLGGKGKPNKEGPSHVKQMEEYFFKIESDLSESEKSEIRAAINKTIEFYPHLAKGNLLYFDFLSLFKNKTVVFACYDCSQDQNKELAFTRIIIADLEQKALLFESKNADYISTVFERHGKLYFYDLGILKSLDLSSGQVFLFRGLNFDQNNPDFYITQDGKQILQIRIMKNHKWLSVASLQNKAPYQWAQMIADCFVFNFSQDESILLAGCRPEGKTDLKGKFFIEVFICNPFKSIGKISFKLFSSTFSINDQMKTITLSTCLEAVDKAFEDFRSKKEQKNVSSEPKSENVPKETNALFRFKQNEIALNSWIDNRSVRHVDLMPVFEIVSELKQSK